MPDLARVARRRWSLLITVMALLLTVACCSLALTIVARLDANDARQVARAERVALNQVTAALRIQCEQQQEAQARLRDLEHADIALQQRLIHVEEHNPFVSPQLRGQRLIAYRTKLASDRRFLRLPAPTPAVCSPFDRPLPTAFRAVG